MAGTWCVWPLKILMNTDACIYTYMCMYFDSMDLKHFKYFKFELLNMKIHVNERDFLGALTLPLLRLLLGGASLQGVAPSFSSSCPLPVCVARCASLLSCGSHTVCIQAWCLASSRPGEVCPA